MIRNFLGKMITDAIYANPQLELQRNGFRIKHTHALGCPSQSLKLIQNKNDKETHPRRVGALIATQGSSTKCFLTKADTNE